MNTSLAFLSGSPGWGELLVVFAVVLVLFGPRRLPELARMIGKALEELRRASQDFRNEVMRIDSDVKDTVRDAVYTGADAADNAPWDITGVDSDGYLDEVESEGDILDAGMDAGPVTETEETDQAASPLSSESQPSKADSELRKPTEPTERKNDLAG